MRWLFLAILLVTIPLLVAYAGKGNRQRDHLLIALGALLFATGSISLDAAVVTWPTWPGAARGVVFSFVDSIALALLLTRRGRTPLPPFLGFFALLWVVMIVTSFNASVKMASFFTVFQFAQVIFLYVALAPEMARDNGIRNIMKGIAIGLMIQAGYVIQQKLTGVVQAAGTVGHQNILGLMLQLSALPLIAMILEGERSKIIYAGAIAAAICVAGGGSRGTIAFFAAGLAALVLLSLLRRVTPRKWAVVGIGAMMALAFLPLTAATLRDRFGDSEIGTTDESRIAFERAARAMSEDHPFGVGPNNFVTVNNTAGYAARAGIAWGGNLLDKPVHNAFLLTRSEMGWAGEIAFILLLGAVATRAFLTGFSARKSAIVGVSLGSAVAITATSIHSNLEYAWFTPEPQRLFFVNAALIAGCMTIAAREAKEKSRRLKNRKDNMVMATPEPARTLTQRPVDHRNSTLPVVHDRPQPQE